MMKQLEQWRRCYERDAQPPAAGPNVRAPASVEREMLAKLGPLCSM